MKNCGTCIHYRSFEDQISPASMSTSPVEFCALTNRDDCSYCAEACAEYEAEQDYIDFLKGEIK
jgi:hypothetical protein